MRTGCHQFLGSGSGKLEIGLVIALRIRDIMILSEGSLIQAEAGLESKCRPFCRAIVMSAIGLGKTSDGFIDILEHMRHHYFAGITRSLELGGIRIKFVINPRNVSELLHLVEIEVGAKNLQRAE